MQGSDPTARSKLRKRGFGRICAARSCGAQIPRIRDTTVTYIRKAKVSSHMYAKYQYNTGVRVRKYVVIYIPTQKYKYSVITDYDIILHNYYITRELKSRLYKIQKTRTHELKERIRGQGKTGGNNG